MAFAAAVRPLLRASDHFARMGGEEFAILLPETELTEGERIAQRLCRVIEELVIDSKQGAFRMTASIGVTELHTDDTDAETTLNRADRLLYEAKSAGRNRVSIG